MRLKNVRPFTSGAALGGLTALALARFGASIPLIILIVVVYQGGLLVLELAHGHPRTILHGWFAGFALMLIGVAVAGLSRPVHPAFLPTMVLSSGAVRLFLEKVKADLRPPSKRD